ncbi:MAG: hypothetical protein FWG21_01965 [Oscillospiraceae bacterium]|nr:hypothetical protein [Oscillospiraceae bacterium]
MVDFDKDAQLDEILNEIRRKREQEEQQRQTNQEEIELIKSQSAKSNTSAVEPEPQPVVEVVKEPTLEMAPPEPETPDFSPKDAVEVNLRSLKNALSGVGLDKDAIGPLNSQSQRVTTEKVVDTEEIEIEDIDSGSIDEVVMHEPVEKHPLFTATSQIDIAAVSIANEAITTNEANSIDLQHATDANNSEAAVSGLLLDEGDDVQNKGILNIKDSAEDNEFKTFFGNTVVIDADPTQRRPKRQRITDFVEGEDGGPVFEDQVIEKDGSLSEYQSDDETDQVNEFLQKRDKNLLLRCILTAFASFGLLIIATIMLTTKESVDESNRFMPLAIFNLVFILMAIISNMKAVAKGLVRLVVFDSNTDSITALALLASLIEVIYSIVVKQTDYVYGSAAAVMALLFTVIGKRISSKRVYDGFISISSDHEKFATAVLDDNAFASRLARAFGDDSPRIIIKRKTGFTDGFLTHSKSRNILNDIVMFPTSIMFCVSLVAAVILYLRTKNLPLTIHMFTIFASLTAPFSATLVNSLPFDRMQKTLSRISCVVPGFSAVNEVIDANCVVLEGRELFPRGNVMLHGIKTFDKERIDKAILYAASILIQSCDTMSHMFLNVIQNKTEMLYDVDNIIYEDGLGFSCWVDQTRLLIGTRELLESREIDVPSRDYENRYTKNSTRDAIYLAVSGKLYAMFVVSYTPNPEVMRAMRSFERENVNVLIRTRDFNITTEKISVIYKVPRVMLATVGESDMEELAKQTAYTNHTQSLFTHIGSLSSYVGGIVSCYKLNSILRITTTIELVTMIVGALLSLIMSFFDGIYLNVFFVILFQLPWLVLIALLSVSKRYSQ